MPDLLVIVPTRGRKQRCMTLLESFQKTTDNADILFVYDEDDKETYADMEWGEAHSAAFAPRGSLVDVINHTAMSQVDLYGVLMFVADDHVFLTPHWDTIMLEHLADMGGSGFLYPDDRRRSDIPEIVMISSDVVKELGFFALPACGHFYIDNAWADLGKQAGILRWCPDVVIEHQHYSITPGIARDTTYSEAEERWGSKDLDAYRTWITTELPLLVAQLRRKFSLDVRWVLSKV